MTKMVFDKEMLDLFDAFILDRISLAIVELKEESPTEFQKEYEQAETIINGLPSSERELVENYVNTLIDAFAEQQHVLYKRGFTDGIKMLKAVLDI